MILYGKLEAYHTTATYRGGINAGEVKTEIFDSERLSGRNKQ